MSLNFGRSPTFGEHGWPPASMANCGLRIAA
jgi:hypothetical protein